MTERPALFAHRDWLRTRLEEAMRFSGLTSPEALAERVGIPAPALFSLLADVSSAPTPETLNAVARYLALPPGQLESLFPPTRAELEVAS